MRDEGDFTLDFDNLPSSIGTVSLDADEEKQSIHDLILNVDKETLEERLNDVKYLSELFRYHAIHLPDGSQEGNSWNGKLEIEHIRAGLSEIGKIPKSHKLAFVRFQASKKQLCNLDLLSLYIHLLVVDLSDNKLREVEALSPLEYLHSLNLEGNKIADVEFVENFPHLQVLNLSRNEIFQANFCLNQLIHLNLARNFLWSAKKFEKKSFPALLHLDLHGNNLSSLDGLELENLERLYVGENSLRSFQGMRGCGRLRTLHARSNRITSIHLPHLPLLEYLNLRNNAIHKFREIHRMTGIDKLETIVLLGNPIQEHEFYRFQALSHLNHAMKLTRLDKDKIGNLEKVNASYSIHGEDSRKSLGASSDGEE